MLRIGFLITSILYRFDDEVWWMTAHESVMQGEHK